MNDREDILNTLMQVIGEEGCGVACEESHCLQGRRGMEIYAGRLYGTLETGADRSRSQGQHQGICEDGVWALIARPLKSKVGIRQP